MGRDRITDLPDDLLTQILSYLTTKDSVKTSVLSKRWEWLWLDVPLLDLDIDNFPDCPDFIDDFLESCERLEKFKINNDYPLSQHLAYHHQFPEWISKCIDLGVQHLDIRDGPEYIMPDDIFESNTLVSLRLVGLRVLEPDFEVYLPCLKILYLQDTWVVDQTLLAEKLISGCPVLEELTLVRFLDIDDQEFPLCLRVRSQSLKRCYLVIGESVQDASDTCYSVEIDAPRLEYLSFIDRQSDAIVLKNLSSLSMIRIDTSFTGHYGRELDPEGSSKKDVIHGFLTAVSSVRRMNISSQTLKILYQYSKFGTIPKFNNLDRSETWFPSYMITYLQVILESCPNLKHLTLGVWKGEEQITNPTTVPQCLLLNLEFVEINIEIMVLKAIYGDVVEITKRIVEEETWKKLAMYFLENSVVLKKLVLRLEDDSSSVISRQDSDILRELHTSTKLSRNCQIIIHRSDVREREDSD